MSYPKVDLTGKRFGLLIVLCRNTKIRINGNVPWKCKCDCGNITNVRYGRLMYDGLTRSCGCLIGHHLVTHGLAKDLKHTKEYNTWTRMIGRCYNRNNKKYPDYGGRGISVCAEWRTDVVAFLKYMGKAPSENHSIDRIDNNDDYKPGNVRWGTAKEQSLNRRSNIIIEYKGEKLPLSLAVEKSKTKFGYATVKSRMQKTGMSFAEAIKSPLHACKRRDYVLA